MAEKRIIIFGCGYVGRALAREAVSLGWETWLHSRNLDSLNQVAEVPAERKIQGNLHEDDWHERLKGDWDLAFNLVSSAGGGLEGYRLSYLEGNRSVCRWAGKGWVRRFLYSSATSVYPQTEGEWVSEGDVPDDSTQLSSSGEVLRQAELEILGSRAFPERVIARLGGIYGPGRHLYLDRIREGAQSLPGDGTGWLNLIFLPDIVQALISLAQAELPDSASVFNVVDNQPARKQEIADWLARRIGRSPIPFEPTESGERTARRKVGGSLPNRRVSNRKIRNLLGWQPSYPDFKAGYEAILQGG